MSHERGGLRLVSVCVARWQLNFTQDPSRPRLYELLTPEEVELFSNIRVG